MFSCSQTWRSVSAKALYISWYLKDFALTGRQVCEHDTPGRCPGLTASAPSGRAAYMGSSVIRNFVPSSSFRAYWVIPTVQFENFSTYSSSLYRIPIQTMNKKKDWQAGLGIKSHKPFCKRSSGGLSCPSSGHSVNKRWASTEQASGMEWTSDGHRMNKRWALIARAVFTECPKVRRFLGTPCRSAALLLCIMPHNDFVILRWRFLMILLSD